MKKEFEATINLTQMDRDALDYFSLSEILATYPDVSGVIINDLEYDYSASIFYAHTGIGRVIFPRHLNETLEDIETLIHDEVGHYAFHPYSYTFGDRHGYSAKFYELNDKNVKSGTYWKIAKEKCKYYKHCMEHDCALCPHCVYFNPYQE